MSLATLPSSGLQSGPILDFDADLVADAVVEAVEKEDEENEDNSSGEDDDASAGAFRYVSAFSPVVAAIQTTRDSLVDGATNACVPASAEPTISNRSAPSTLQAGS